jgi:hypothetical protein
MFDVRCSSFLLTRHMKLSKDQVSFSIRLATTYWSSALPVIGTNSTPVIDLVV